MNIQIMFTEKMPVLPVAVINEDGIELTDEQLTLSIAHGIPFPDDPEKAVGETVPIHVHAVTPGWTARDSNGVIWPIDYILADTASTMTKATRPIMTHRYSGGGRDYGIASAELAVGNAQGRIMLVRNSDDTTSVIWTPDRHGMH